MTRPKSLKGASLRSYEPPWTGYSVAYWHGLAVEGDVAAWAGVSEKDVLAMLAKMPRGVRVPIVRREEGRPLLSGPEAVVPKRVCFIPAPKGHAPHVLLPSLTGQAGHPRKKATVPHARSPLNPL